MVIRHIHKFPQCVESSFGFLKNVKPQLSLLVWLDDSIYNMGHVVDTWINYSGDKVLSHTRKDKRGTAPIYAQRHGHCMLFVMLRDTLYVLSHIPTTTSE